MIQITFQILILLGWIVYSSLFGKCDAWYWYYGNQCKYALKDKLKDLHPHYLLSRSIVGLTSGLLMASILNQNLFFGVLYTISLGLILPFFHNGFYYMERNNINPSVYPKRFKDMSTSSIAPVNFTYNLRLLMALLGVIFWFSLSFI
jgi:hypothetical protein